MDRHPLWRLPRRGTGRLGLSALPPTTRRLSMGGFAAADAMLGQSSGPAAQRLLGRARHSRIRARGLVREGVGLDGRCGRTSSPWSAGHFRREGELDALPVGHHHHDEERYVIGACEIIDDVEQNLNALCGHSLHR